MTLSTYSGHQTLLIFFNPSRIQIAVLEQHLPAISAIAKECIQAVLVSGADKKRTRPFVKERHIHLPVIIAPRSANTMFEHYTITGTPSYCFIDEQGKIQSMGYINDVASEWKALTKSLIESDTLL